MRSDLENQLLEQAESFRLTEEEYKSGSEQMANTFKDKQKEAKEKLSILKAQL